MKLYIYIYIFIYISGQETKHRTEHDKTKHRTEHDREIQVE